jgi:predicted TPR repeat methyltransferase
MVEKPGTVRAEVSLTEALSLGIEFHRRGWLEPAERVYRAVLEHDPTEPNALHYLGVLHHQSGRNDDAIELLRAAIAHRPDWFDAHNNLGNVLQESGRREEAIAAYEKARALRPGDAGLLNNLGVVLKSAGRLEAAEAALREAIAQAPESAEAWHNLGNVLERAQRDREAGDAFAQAVRLQPKRKASWRNLATSMARSGRADDARRVFDEWLTFEPDNPAALHLKAAVLGETPPARAGDAYVRDLFSGLAANFDLRLAELAYRAPELLAERVATALGPGRGTLDVLDAGAGTGWCGPLLRPWARRLVGVDLSADMLERARERGAYDDLQVAELTAWLLAAADRFDLAVCADTLVYFGALDDVLTGFARVLRPGGWLAFTVERCPDEATAGFRLGIHGRYAHAEPHVERTLALAGFSDVAIERVVPRYELGEPVDGLAVIARRAG